MKDAFIYSIHRFCPGSFVHPGMSLQKRTYLSEERAVEGDSVVAVHRPHGDVQVHQQPFVLLGVHRGPYPLPQQQPQVRTTSPTTTSNQELGIAPYSTGLTKALLNHGTKGRILSGIHRVSVDTIVILGIILCFTKSRLVIVSSPLTTK